MTILFFTRTGDFVGNLWDDDLNIPCMDFLVSKEEFEKEIRDLEQTSDKKPICYSHIIDYCREVLELYRKEVRSHKFRDSSKEISFFKEQKQIPSSYLIYYLRLREFELKAPFTEKERRKAVRKKIEKINRFLSSHHQFLQYTELDQTYLDEFYFTRKFFDKQDHLFNYSYNRDPDFSTSHDLLLSEIKACKMLLSFYQDQLREENSSAIPLEKGSEIRWTSSKAALTELIYALYATGALNNGASDIGSITSSFENFFNINLENVYRTYSDLKARKGERTKYLNELKFHLEQRMRRDDEL